MDHLRYPIGKFSFNVDNFSANRAERIVEISRFPSKLSTLLESVDPTGHEKSYRPGGWNIRQLVHHLSDSHANMYIRVKSALAHDGTHILGYDEHKWATFADNELPLKFSVKMLEGIHAKIAYLFGSLSNADWRRSYYHTGDQRSYTLAEVLELYVWHGNHHLAHIKLAATS